MFDDFRYSLRLLYKVPAFTALAITVMTCGLSISIYIFSLVNTLVYKDLPFPESENIVAIDKVLNGIRLDGGQFYLSPLLAIEKQSSSFDDVIFYQYFNANINIETTAKRILAVNIEPGGFEFTNTKPLLGRTLNKSDTRKDSFGNVVISYKVWAEQFSFDKQVIGKNMLVNSQAVKVVGVMPEGYRFPYYTDIWFTLGSTHNKPGRFANAGAIAKLKSGISVSEANQDVARIMSEYNQKYKLTNLGVSAYVETLQKQVLGSKVMPAVYALIAATLFILLLSCLNTGSLLLSKALERSNEIAMRLALGAPRYRLIMQMLWESAIICFVSGCLALLIAAWALQLSNPIFAHIGYDHALYWWVFAIDSDTVMMTIVIVICTIFIAGFLPCWKATSGQFNAILRQGEHRITNQHVGRLSQLLMKVQVGLSALILFIAALFVINTLQSNQHLNQFDENKLLTFTIDLPNFDYRIHFFRHQFLKSLEESLEVLDGVKAVAITSAPPGNGAWVSKINKVGETNETDKLSVNTVFVNHDLFSLINITPIEGRLFNQLDTIQTKLVVVISDSLAQKMWPSESAIGKSISLTSQGGFATEVIGVIPHIDHGTAFNSAVKEGGIYLLNTQMSSTYNTVMVQFEGDQALLIERIRQTLYKLDENISAFDVMTYQNLLDKNLSGVVFGSKLLTLLALIALILAASGIYGVTANSINQCAREIGIRRAVGATKARVLQEFTLKMMKPLLVGLTLGLLLAVVICYYLLTTLLISNSLMFVVFCSVFVALMIVVSVGIVVPLLKILKSQPADVLRAE